MTRRSVYAALVVAMCVSVPLQWQSLATTALGELRIFHIAALALLCRFTVVRWPFRIWRSQPPGVKVLPAMFAAYTAAAIAGGTLNGVEVVEYVQHALYGLVGFAFAAFVLDATRRRELPRFTWWSGVLALAVLTTALWISGRAAGVDMIATLRQALVSADPDVINFQLFRRVFAVEDLEARSNIRHEVFAALVMANFIALWAISLRPPRSRWTSAMIRAGAGVSIAFAVVSLSRSVILILMIAALLPAARAMLSGRFRRLGPAAPLLVLGGFALLLPAAGVLGNRFLQEQGSYEARQSGLSVALAAIGRNPVLGAFLEDSPHNFVLDAWVNAGLLAGVLAAALVWLTIRHWIALFGRYVRRPSPIDAVALAAGVVPIVRMFTAGGGLLHLGSWMAWGLFMGVAMAPSARQVPLGKPSDQTRSAAEPPLVAEAPRS